MTYEEWEENAHERVRAEPIWQFLGYRKALFFYELDSVTLGHFALNYMQSVS
jgi:hypothetical protein